MKRKIYDKLVKWKEETNGEVALLIDGARRIGKSYIVEQFAKEKGFPFVDVSASEVVVKVSDICGDIDADNAITSNDALKILRVSIGVDKLIDAQTKLADIDSDGNITSGDALAVLRHSVGIGCNVKIGKKINS